MLRLWNCEVGREDPNQERDRLQHHWRAQQRRAKVARHSRGQVQVAATRFDVRREVEHRQHSQGRDHARGLDPQGSQGRS